MAEFSNSRKKFFSAVPILFASVAMIVHPLATAAAGTADVNDHAFLEAQAPIGSAKETAPKYRYLFGAPAKWSGPMRWKYNHANAPASLAGNKAAVIAQLRSSLDKWTATCGVTYVYDGETTVAPNTVINDPVRGSQPDNASVVGWGSLDASMGGWTYDWYVQNGNDRVLVDADMTLSTTSIRSLDDLDKLATHEWGHALGLDHSNVESTVMAGPPMTSYTLLATLQPDDVHGCRCQYGLPAGATAPRVCSLPNQVDFGSVAVGTTSTPQPVTFTNSGNGPLQIQASVVSNAQFAHIGGCQPGAIVQPGSNCTLQVQVIPATAGSIAGQLKIFTNDGDYQFGLQASGVQGSSLPAASAPTVEVVEYYNPTLDHYFITWIADEMGKLDWGATPTRWIRTGKTFKAYADALTGTSQVCRLYIPPNDGDSHFFGRNTTECNASRQAHPDFILEDPDYMQVYLPVMGSCPAGTQPVYRLFNNRVDANHRYVTDRTIRTQMMATGWIAEGDGPDMVAMCVPG